jgi:uncharacterized protein YceK
MVHFRSFTCVLWCLQHKTGVQPDIKKQNDGEQLGAGGRSVDDDGVSLQLASCATGYVTWWRATSRPHCGSHLSRTVHTQPRRQQYAVTRHRGAQNTHWGCPSPGHTLCVPRNVSWVIKQDETDWTRVRRGNAYRVLVGNPQGRDCFTNLEVEGRIII